MDFLDLVRKRQSVRRYDSRPIEAEKLERCLEAARLAPSASNSQPWTFIVVDEPELRRKVAVETYGKMDRFNKFALQAPVIVVVVLEKMPVITRVGAMIMKREYPLIDIGIAAEHLCLQAAADGLGTCMLGWFNEKSIRQLLGIPREKRIGLLITLGYPGEGYPLREKKRKGISEVVRRNAYGK
jgi:nitroreductase